MNSVTLRRLMIAILTFTFGLTLPSLSDTYSQTKTTVVSHLARSPNLDGQQEKAFASTSAKQTADNANPDLASEISLERIYDGCEDCPDRKIVLRREGSKKFEDATVTEIDLHSKKERRGRLGAYHFNNLLRLIEAQGYFSMYKQYAMGVIDSVIVTIGVNIGDKRKVIKTRSEGDVPIQLWGIYYAIDGALGNVKWENRP
jgi:hypothetical protein